MQSVFFSDKTEMSKNVCTFLHTGTVDAAGFLIFLIASSSFTPSPECVLLIHRLVVLLLTILQQNASEHSLQVPFLFFKPDCRIVAVLTLM